MACKNFCIIYIILLIGLAQAQDVWDEEFQEIETIEQDDSLLLALCNNVNLMVYDKIEQRQFDCATKEWRIMEEKIIKKREATDEVIEEEGSGAPDETNAATGEEAPTDAKAEPKIAQIPEEPTKEEPKTDKGPIEEEHKPVEEEHKPVEEKPKPVEEEPKPEEGPKEAEAEGEPKTEETTAKPNIVEDNVVATTNKDDLEKPEGLIPIKEQPNPLQNMLPIGQDEATDQFQDGNTLMENHPEIDGVNKNAPLQIAGPRSMQAQDTDKEKEKSLEGTEAPKTGESAKAEKDSNILIMMFVGVVVVGIAAFGYNYIRKRNQNNAMEVNDVEKVEKAEKVEQEMHPLMNGNKQQPQDHEAVYKPTTSNLN